MKVLIVQNDLVNFKILKIRLESLGCEVLYESSPENAVKVACENMPDLILLDISSHKNSYNDFNILRDIRNNANLSEIPIIVHSVYFKNSSELPNNLPQVDDVLSKPFLFLDLKAIVKRFRPVKS